VPHLAACRRGNVEIVAVYTQPDRPAGRGRALAQSPVKQAALAAGIAVEQPENFKDPAARERLRAYAPDLLVVVAYGLILPKKVLAIPRLGGWNVHASLLPRWRGAAPIQRALLAGDAQTGVCLMQMAAGLDTGPGAAERCIADRGGRTPRQPARQVGRSRRAAVGPTAWRKCRVAGRWQPSRSPGKGVTYAHKLDKAEASLDWNQAAMSARAQGARVSIHGRRRGAHCGRERCASGKRRLCRRRKRRRSWRRRPAASSRPAAKGSMSPVATAPCACSKCNAPAAGASRQQTSSMRGPN
jgi:methionyl-tRNA formyltransferase